MSCDELYAHSWCAAAGSRHLLEDHLRGTAALARRFGAVFDAADITEYLALVHDVGKGDPAWQERLIEYAERNGKPVGIPHKEAGTGLAAEYVGKPLAAAVQGHHGGLPSRPAIKVVLDELRGDSRDARAAREAVESVARLVPEIRPAQRFPPPSWLTRLTKNRRQLEMDLLVRMAFSCLVDADFLDTAAHFAGTRVQVAADADMTLLGARFESRRAKLLAQRQPSPVDEIRNQVYAEALASASAEPGFHVLHVPTGGAKTIASAGFALRHAAEHGLRRVVFAVPFISITQQNAQVYRDLLDPGEGEPGGPVVLEHHSSVRLDKEDGAGVWARLAAENWDAAAVVTTTVQLFESLFSNRPSAMRKVHRLAGAVIVLDEVQALPDRLLRPILSVLRGLVDNFGASVVLASATQPEFWSLPQLDGLERRTMVADVPELFERLKRVRYEWRMGGDVTWESIAQEIATVGGDRVLTVVNTTRDAAHLHRLLTGAASPQSSTGPADELVGFPDDPPIARVSAPVLHLSTRMTAEHRREVIERVRTDLRDGHPIHVVSTSLIEAGVDLDFPRVYRAWAPAESLQQAAGRCNRDNRLPGLGTVVIFRPIDGGVPQDRMYERALRATETHFGEGTADPDDLEALRRYYNTRYSSHGSDGRLMGEHIEELRRDRDFPAVAAEFRMIDDRFSQPVVVIRDTKSAEEQEQIMADVALLHDPYPCGPEPLRRLQPHTATLPRHEVSDALRTGLAEPIVGDLVLWLGHYDEQRGLDAEQVEDRGGYSL